MKRNMFGKILFLVIVMHLLVPLVFIRKKEVKEVPIMVERIQLNEKKWKVKPPPKKVVQQPKPKPVAKKVEKPKPVVKKVEKPKPKPVAKKVEKPKPVVKKVEKPKPVVQKPKPSPVVVKAKKESREDLTKYRELVVSIIQDALQLPEKGEVTLKVILGLAGKVTRVEIVKTKSTKNSEYLAKYIPTLLFPSSKQEQNILMKVINE